MITADFMANTHVTTIMGNWWHTPFIRLENYLEHVKHSTRTAPVKLLNTMRENRFTTIIYYRMAMEIH